MVIIKKYRERPKFVIAIEWSGKEEDFADTLIFIQNINPSFSAKFDSGDLIIPNSGAINGELRAKPGYFIIDHLCHGNVYQHSIKPTDPTLFEFLYEEVDDE